MSMVICPKCKLKVSDNDGRCFACGTSLKNAQKITDSARPSSSQTANRRPVTNAARKPVQQAAIPAGAKKNPAGPAADHAKAPKTSGNAAAAKKEPSANTYTGPQYPPVPVNRPVRNAHSNIGPVQAAYAGQPVQQAPAGQPVQQAPAGQPVQQAYAGQPVQQAYAGQPVPQAYAGQPVQQAYAGQPVQQAYAGQPVQQAYAGQPVQQAYAGQPGQQYDDQSGYEPISVGMPKPVEEMAVRPEGSSEGISGQEGGFAPIDFNDQPSSPIENVVFTPISDIGTPSENLSDKDFAPVEDAQPSGQGQPVPPVDNPEKAATGEVEVDFSSEHDVDMISVYPAEDRDYGYSGQRLPDFDRLEEMARIDKLLKRVRGLGIFLILFTGLINAVVLIFNDYIYDYMYIVGAAVGAITVIACVVFILLTKDKSKKNK